MELSDLPLRERKRIRAMRRIQTVAMELFERDGFDAVPIDRIASKAEVSPSSVYRWFGTKEKIIIWDEYDPQALAAIEQALQDAPPVEAVGHVIRAVVESAVRDDDERIRRRLRLSFENPSIEAASTLQAYEMADLIAAILARKLEVDPNDLEVQVTAHAFTGAVLGAIRAWYDSGFTLTTDEVIDAPLKLLERGADLS